MTVLEMGNIAPTIDLEVQEVMEGTGGATDYDKLNNKPSINDVELSGDKSLEDLGITQVITGAIGNVTQISFEVVESFDDLPLLGEVGTFYLVPNNTRENNNYREYIWDVNKLQYELIGTIQSNIDLSNYYTKPQIDELINKVPSGQNDCAPVGTIISFMGVNAPMGYLKCDGETYSISQYQELANHFKSNFGSVYYFGGNGSSTFAVPDLRGEFLRGTGTNSHTGNGSGADTAGVHQDATKHLKIVNYNGAVQFKLGSTNSAELDHDSVTSLPRATNIDGHSFYEASQGLYTSRPTNTSVMFCIKYKKIVEIP